MRRVTIRLSDDLLASLDELALRAQVHRSVLVERALSAYLKASVERDQAIDQVQRRAAELGLFGSGILEPDSPESWDESGPRRMRLPFRFMGEPVIIDPCAPPRPRDADGNPLLPGGYYANYCEVCGESFVKHDDGECPE